jgi:hypothetical protein
MAIVDNCGDNDYLDRTAPGASREIIWDFSSPGRPDKCMKIHAGQSVTWVGSLSGHPLEEDEGQRPNPIGPPRDQGESATVTFTQTGVFGYRCNFHFEMRGAIQVVAAPPPPTSVAWSGAGGALGLGTLLFFLGLATLRRGIRLHWARRFLPWSGCNASR